MRTSEIEEIKRVLRIGKKLGLIQKDKFVVPCIFPFKAETPWGSDSFSVKIKRNYLILSSDQHVEGTHFSFDFMEPDEVGERALRCAFSDIIAAGGKPLWAFVNVSAPSSTIVDKIGDGISNLSEKIRVNVVGGDISYSEKTSISSFVAGFSYRKPLSRFGAKPGDRIIITGTIGDAALAFQVLKTRGRKFAEKYIPYSLEKFLMPPIERTVKLMVKIQKLASFSADVSDGTLRTVEWLSILNGLSLEFFPERLPFSEEFLRFAKDFFSEPQSVAATWGDDYEIMFGVPEKHFRKRNFYETVRKYGEVVGIFLAKQDEKRAFAKKYPYKKLKGLHRTLFIFFTHKINWKYQFEHFR